MTAESSQALKVDHDGVPTAKIVYWGPTMGGKTTALTIVKVLKTLEDPGNTYKFLKLEDPTGRTLFFDQAVFGLGTDKTTGLPFLKYHIFTVPGQDRHAGQRKVVLQGAHGLIIIIDSEKARWDENRGSLIEINQLVGERLSNGDLPFYICVNKMDLPAEERISALEVGKLLVEAGVNENMRDASSRIVEMSCLQAKDDLKQLLSTSVRSDITDTDGKLKKSARPRSVQRVIQPVEALLREVIVRSMKDRG
jgi:signal recognition particle receptor subunit beta